MGYTRKHTFALVLVLCIFVNGIFVSKAQNETVYWIAFIGSPQHTETAPDCNGLCIVRTDGEEYRLLTDEVMFSSRLEWSPDGEWIAFTNDAGDLQRIAIADGRIEAILTARDALIQAGGSIETFDQQNEQEFMGPRASPIRDFIWSPDGERMYFSIARAYGMSYSPADLHSIAVDGTHFQTLTEVEGSFSARNPSFSPDGEWLMYQTFSRCRSCDFRGGRLYAINPSTKENRLIADFDGGLGKHDAHWSVDGRHIYMIDWQQNGDEIYGNFMRVNADGTDPQILMDNFTKAPRPDTAITQHSYYLVDVSSCPTVHIIELDSAELTTYPDNDFHCFEFIAPAPAGDYVALSGATAASFGAGGIYIMEASGDYRTVIDGFAEIYSPAWSPVPIDD